MTEATVANLNAAALSGDLPLLNRLIQLGVDPSGENNALRLAATNGHLAVVERLLEDQRVDPSVYDNYALGWAARMGHVAIVERLLRDTRVDPSHYDNHLIRVAACKGNVAVVDALLQDERVDPSAGDDEAIRLAAKYCCFSVVLRLLQDKRVRPTAMGNEVFLWALSAFDIALSTCRVAPSLRCVAVIDRLLCDVRVLETIADDVFGRLVYVGMVRSRFSLVCIGLQDLDLPALITLEILDSLIPNSIRMAAKWDLIVAVKHFHDRRPPTQLEP